MYTAFVGVVRKYVLAFSVRVNGLRILSVERPPKDGSTLPALHGIRFLSMSWVILGHTYVIGIAVTSKLLMILMLTVICSVVFQLRKQGALIILFITQLMLVIIGWKVYRLLSRKC